MTNRRWLSACLGLAFVASSASFHIEPAHAGRLKGSKASMKRQNSVAKQHDFSYLKNASQVRRFVRAGYLVHVPNSRHYELSSGVSFPYARPEVKLFIERLGRQYHHATGEKLVVTSLTRPKTHQPRNASKISVHPCGMAVDFRKSRSRKSRQWLEQVLVTLEKRGVIEATMERHPPHYHVAVFPKQYASYVAKKLNQGTMAKYKVQAGDSLWDIARQHGTSIRKIQSANELADASIYPGQVLQIPTLE